MTTLDEPSHAKKPQTKERDRLPAPKAGALPTPAIATSGDLLLQRQAQCACGGDCPRCEKNNLRLQTKLRISSPGDALEQEADRVAARVMSLPAPASAERGQRLAAAPAPRATANGSRAVRTTTVSRKEAAGEVKLKRKTARAATRKAATVVNSPTPLPHGLPARLSALERGGEPLSKELRDFFEPRFETDLGHVRIHRGAQSDLMAREVDARAFTVGSHIVFADDSWHPQTEAGRQLLAHELAHVQQQHAQGIFALSRTPRCQGILNASLPQSVEGGQSPIDGVTAHRIITAEFIRDHGNFRRLRIETAASSPYRTEGCSSDVSPSVINPLVYDNSPRSMTGRGIPDLLLWRGGTVELGEIKPATWGCLTFAEEQVHNYVEKGNAPYNAAYRQKRGINHFTVMPMSSWTQLPLRLQEGSTHLLVDWCSPGVIGYLGVRNEDPDIFICGMKDQGRIDRFLDAVIGRARTEVDRVVNAHVNGLIKRLMHSFSLREVLRTIGGNKLADSLPPAFDKNSQRMEASLRQQIQLAKDKFVTQLEEMLKSQLRKLLRHTLNRLCQGVMAVSITQLMKELRDHIRRQLPIAAVAVARAMMSAVLQTLQKALQDALSEYGGAILGVILAIVAIVAIAALVVDDASLVGTLDDALIAPLLRLLAYAGELMSPLFMLLARMPALATVLLGPSGSLALQVQYGG